MDAAAIDQAWQGPWRRMTRRMRRFCVALPTGLGLLYWVWTPFQLLAMVLDDAARETHLANAALFFGLGLIGVTTGAVLHRRFAPEHRAEDALKRQGARVTGQLLRKRYVPAAGKIPLNSHYLFGAEVPGAPPVFARLTAGNGIPVGCPVTIAYDPARPGEGVVVETAGQLRRRARSG